MPTIFYVSFGAMWLLLLILGVLVLLVYRHFGVMALGSLEGVQRDGLPVGERAPEVSLTTVEGMKVKWAPRPGTSELLIFAAPDCQPCAKVLPFVSRLATSANHHGVQATAIVTGPHENVARLVEKFRPAFPCLSADGIGATDRYRVRVTPFAFVIGSDGRILAKGLCSDAGRLRGLLVASGLEEAAAAVEPEPAIQLVHQDVPATTDVRRVSR
ncbi:MAG: TlpA family protein disulfide reductase [Thermomicrobiales bacterium]